MLDEEDYSAGMGTLLVIAVVVTVAAVAVFVDRRHADLGTVPSAHAPDTPANASQSGWESDLEIYRADHPELSDPRVEKLRAHGIGSEDPLLRELSRRLLEFSGGSVDDYATFSTSVTRTSC